MELHRKTAFALGAAQHGQDSGAPADGGQSDVLPDQIRGGEFFERVEVVVLEGVEEPLDDVGLVGDCCGGGGECLVGHIARA